VANQVAIAACNIKREFFSSLGREIGQSKEKKDFFASSLTSFTVPVLQQKREIFLTFRTEYVAQKGK